LQKFDLIQHIKRDPKLKEKVIKQVEAENCISKILRAFDTTQEEQHSK